MPSSGIAGSYGSFIPSFVFCFFLKKSPISCNKILYDSPPRVMEIKTKVFILMSSFYWGKLIIQLDYVGT